MDRASLLIHEAAHVVVGRFYGTEVHGVDLAEGVTDMDKGWHREVVAVIDLAGCVAESLLLGYRVELVEGDIPLGTDAQIEKWREHTERVVKMLWPKILTEARVLLLTVQSAASGDVQRGHEGTKTGTNEDRQAVGASDGLHGR